MTWSELLFAHWPLEPRLVAETLPRGLELDTFEGRAWLGVVPFRMSNVRLRDVPLFGFAEAFPELNVRTYVRRGDKFGVWFFSLDAASALAVAGARAWFHLPYFTARMRCDVEGEWVSYASTRSHAGAPAAELRARYGAISTVRTAARGSLEHWLTERYCLFSLDASGELLVGEIDHAPWPLQDARAELEVNSMARAAGFDLPRVEPLLHFARRIDVVAWAPEPAP